MLQSYSGLLECVYVAFGAITNNGVNALKHGVNIREWPAGTSLPFLGNSVTFRAARN